MIKKLQKSDYLFIVALLAGLLLHIIFLYSPVYVYDDETFYPTIPLRLIIGDSLIQHEWHLTQFSSLFLYLPVRLWLVLKGSTDGIILYLRYVYLTIHTLTSVGIYAYFRKYGIWAIVATMMFYTQTPYRITAISYNSMFALFLLFFIFFLLLIYQKSSSLLYISAGFCFGACCVANPFFCTVFALYIIACIVWFQKNKVLQRKIVKTSNSQRKKTEKIIARKAAFYETYNKFFNKKAVIFFSCGIAVVAVICLVYFFATGGTIASILGNISNLFSSSEYGIFSSSLAIKLKETLTVFNKISFNLPFLLPVLYVALFFDKKRKEHTHRTIYIILSLVIAILYFFGVVYVAPNSSSAFAVSLPFIIISTVCYILTTNKDKKLFYFAWCPCAIGAIVHYIASNTHLTSIFMVLVIGNIAGGFFVRDLFKELNDDLKAKEASYKNKKNKKLIIVCRSVICIGLCSQLIFQCFAYMFDRIPEKNYTQALTGPSAGIYMSKLYYDDYIESINDLNVIKERSEKNDHVLIVSCHNWMYLYIDRPFAIPTTWQLDFQPEHLKLYYKANPDKTPKYIYVGYADSSYKKNYDQAQEKAAIMSEMFDCVQEELSNGILLTVNGKNMKDIHLQSVMF